MSELRQNILVAGAVSAPAASVRVDDLGTTLVFEIAVEVTAATLQANVQFTGAITEAASYPLVAVGQGLSQITQLPAGVTFPSPFNTLTFNNPGVGRHVILVKGVAPALRIWQPLWNYTSGGGTVKCTITAWGFGIGTTP